MVTAADESHYAGIPTLINSIRRTSRAPGLLRFYVLDVSSRTGLGDGPKDQENLELSTFLECYGISVTRSVQDGGPSNVVLLAADTSQLEKLIAVKADKSTHGNLASLANFARFLIPELLPGLSMALYVDSDAVFQADVRELWVLAGQELRSSKLLLAAVERARPQIGSFFQEKMQDEFREKYGKVMPWGEPSFNAGLTVLNLDLWRKERLSDDLFFWMELNQDLGLWDLGTQPLLLTLAAHKGWVPLPATWNLDGLGYKRDLSEEKLAAASVLHWSGKNKPWLPSGMYKTSWQRYQMLECSGRGECSLSKRGCLCDEGFAGKTCRNRT